MIILNMLLIYNGNITPENKNLNRANQPQIIFKDKIQIYNNTNEWQYTVSYKITLCDSASLGASPDIDLN